MVRTYHIEHVQSGGEFRSSDFAEVTRWMHDINLLYMSEVVNPSVEKSDEEDVL